MRTYVLIRSRRKSLAMYIRDAGIEIRAPMHMPKSRIDEFVASKEDWIANNLALYSERKEQRESFSLSYGDFVTYRGKPYPIISKAGDRVGFDGEHFYMPPDLSGDWIKESCVQIYRLLAKADLTEKALAYGKVMGVAPAAVKVNSAKARWGSCSTNKNLNFSWRLIMADDDVIDYVVVHELAHISQMNHSKLFWSIVEGILPDYRERKTRLKALQMKLAREAWD